MVYYLFLALGYTSTLLGIKTHQKFIDHNLKADYRILIIFGTPIPDTTCYQMQGYSSFHLNYHMLLQYLRKLKHMKSALKWTKNARTIRDITDKNLEKDNEIF